MVDGLGIISMTRVFESYGIEPYDYFVQENLRSSRGGAGSFRAKLLILIPLVRYESA